MTTLFDLSPFEVAIAECVEDEDLVGENDPAYMFPPIHKTEQETVAAIAPEEMKSERRSPKSLDFHGGLLPLGKMIAATDLMEFSDALDELQANVIELCYELNLLIVNDGFQTPELEPLQADLKALVAAIAPNSETTVAAAAIAPLPDIEEEISTKNGHPTPPNSPETLKGGYIEEKQIKKNGKIIGTYLYERYRENGKLKSKYLGKKTGTFARSP